MEGAPSNKSLSTEVNKSEVNNDSNKNVEQGFDTQNDIDLDINIPDLPTLGEVLQAEAPELLNDAQVRTDQQGPSLRHSTRDWRKNSRYYNGDFETSFSDDK